MRFSKAGFLALLATLFVMPFLIWKIIWIVGAVSTVGTMCFKGKSLNGTFTSEYPVLKFSTNGKDTVFFNGSEGVDLKRGQQVHILYYRENPSCARVNSFQGLWVETVIYMSIPFVLLLIIFLHAGIIPKNSSIILGRKPFIYVLPYNSAKQQSGESYL
ncbi:MAG: hypothetical protein ABIX01_11915 [Chitinophagaceae bacterium]